MSLGYTIQIQNIEKYFDEINKDINIINSSISPLSATATLYMSPPYSEALRPHIDAHDIFIQQIDGKKHWRFWKSNIPPVSTYNEVRMYDSIISDVTNNDADLEVELDCDSILYIPSGIIHYVTGSCQNSIHIATWIEQDVKI